MQAKFQVSYASDLHSLLTALFYIEAGCDLFGWHASHINRGLAAAFYVIENFYANETAVVHRSLEDDVYGPWVMESENGKQTVRCPVPEILRHELERLQSRFVKEWLFFLGDPGSQAQCHAYEQLHLPLHTANISVKKLARMANKERIWHHQSAGFDPNVLEFLQKHHALYQLNPSVDAPG